MKPNYEPGMKITYDGGSKRVIVAFRGRITVLPETYETEDVAVRAGEDHCWRLGWDSKAQTTPQKGAFRSLFC